MKLSVTVYFIRYGQNYMYIFISIALEVFSKHLSIIG